MGPLGRADLRRENQFTIRPLRCFAHVDRLHLGIGLDLGRRAVLQQTAVVHHGHALDDAQRDVQIVLDQHEADMRRQRFEELHQVGPLGGRQAGGRLVEQDQPRRAGQRHADLELALLAVRERCDRLVGDAGQADLLEQFVGRRAGTAGAPGRRKPKRPRDTPRTARNRLSRTVRSRNSSDD